MRCLIRFLTRYHVSQEITHHKYRKRSHISAVKMKEHPQEPPASLSHSEIEIDSRLSQIIARDHTSHLTHQITHHTSLVTNRMRHLNQSLECHKLNESLQCHELNESPQSDEVNKSSAAHQHKIRRITTYHISHTNVTNSMSHRSHTKSIGHLQHTITRYDVSLHITYHISMSRTQ